MTHTKGKLHAYQGILIASDLNEVLAQAGNNPSDKVALQDARRLVACWNACDGLSTKKLEDVRDWQKAGIETANTLRKERDELLAVLGKVVEWNDKYPSHRIYSHHRIIEIAEELDVICDESRTILAKYKETK